MKNYQLWKFYAVFSCTFSKQLKMHCIFFYFQEELDSDEEWDYLVEVTEQASTGGATEKRHPSEDGRIIEKLMTDSAFISKMQSALEAVAGQVLDGLLEGASRLRQILRVLRSLLTTPW